MSRGATETTTRCPSPCSALTRTDAASVGSATSRCTPRSLSTTAEPSDAENSTRTANQSSPGSPMTSWTNGAAPSQTNQNRGSRSLSETSGVRETVRTPGCPYWTRMRCVFVDPHRSLDWSWTPVSGARLSLGERWTKWTPELRTPLVCGPVVSTACCVCACAV